MSRECHAGAHLTSMWTMLRKRRALRSYRRLLGQRLYARYGRERYYTPAQVRSTVKAYKMDEDFVCLALAMYCERSAFDADHLARGEVCDFDDLHVELAGGAAAIGCGEAATEHGGDWDASSFGDD